MITLSMESGHGCCSQYYLIVLLTVVAFPSLDHHPIHGAVVLTVTFGQLNQSLKHRQFVGIPCTFFHEPTIERTIKLISVTINKSIPYR